MAASAEFPKMQYTRLGESGLQVSRICLGMMSFGDPNKWKSYVLPEADARQITQRALELGVNFFDTANMYSAGTSEEVTGSLLREFGKRDELVVATKCYFHVPNPRAANIPPNTSGLSRKHIMQANADSLNRLGMDYIDLYQYHRWDNNTPIEETIAATHDLIRSGKIRYWGFSSCYAWQFSKILYTCDKLGCPRPISMQDHYNLVYREEEREMIPLCQDNNIGLIPWSPLARGMLCGRTRPAAGAEPVTLRDKTDDFSKMLYDSPSDWDVAEAVTALSARKGVPAAQLALAWMLGKPYISAPIIGATKIQHIEDAVRALGVTLTADEVKEIEAPYKPHGIKGHW